MIRRLAWWKECVACRAIATRILAARPTNVLMCGLAVPSKYSSSKPRIALPPSYSYNEHDAIASVSHARRGSWSTELEAIGSKMGSGVTLSA